MLTIDATVNELLCSGKHLNTESLKRSCGVDENIPAPRLEAIGTSPKANTNVSRKCINCAVCMRMSMCMFSVDSSKARIE